MTGAAAAEPEKLSTEAIKSTLSGTIFELDTPLGTKVPIRFSSNGLMAGEAGALAGFLGAERDRGRWWVADDRLCMKWFRWFDADTNCFSLRQQGKIIYWQEQGGRSGTATIAGRFEKEPVRPVFAAAAAPTPSPDAFSNVSRFASSAPFAHSAAEMHAASAPPVPQPAPQPPAREPAKLPSEPARVQPKKPEQEKAVVPPPPVEARRPRPQQTARTVARPPSRQPASPTFRVARVEIDDVLNVREGPSEYHPRVGAIAPDGRGIEIVGPCQGLWCPIRHGRVSGWVNTYYLTRDDSGPTAIATSR